MRWSFATIVLVPRDRPFIRPDAAERRRTFAWAHATGFTGIELADEWLDFTRLDHQALGETRKEIADAGLQVSSLNIPRCHFTRESPAQHEMARIDRALGAGPVLGAEVINLSLAANPLSPDARPSASRGMQATPEEFERAVETITRLARLAAASGIRLVLELHDDGLLDTPELCLQLLRQVDSPAVRLNPDVANICRGPGPLPDWRQALQLLAPHAGNWHVKNYRAGQPVALPDGDIDYATAWGLMRSAGYAGWVSIESRLGDVRTEQRAGLAYLQSLAARAVA